MPHRGAGSGPLYSAGAAVRLHPFGFGIPVAVIAAAIAYLIVAGPVSIRLGHPGPASGHSRTVAQAPSSVNPAQAAPRGSDPGGQPSRPPAPSRPVSGFVNPGAGGAGGAGGGGMSGPDTTTGTRHAQPTVAPAAPAAAASPASPVPASTPTASAPPPTGTSGGCVDLAVLTLCM